MRRGHLINADVNGALNIMRKNVLKEHPQLVDSLSDYIKTQTSYILNPFKCSIKELFNSPYDFNGYGKFLDFRRPEAA